MTKKYVSIEHNIRNIMEKKMQKESGVDQTGLDASKLKTRARSTPGSEATKDQQSIPSEVPEKTKELAKDIAIEIPLALAGGTVIKNVGGAVIKRLVPENVRKKVGEGLVSFIKRRKGLATGAAAGAAAAAAMSGGNQQTPALTGKEASHIGVKTSASDTSHKRKKLKEQIGYGSGKFEGTPSVFMRPIPTIGPGHERSSEKNSSERKRNKQLRSSTLHSKVNEENVSRSKVDRKKIKNVARPDSDDPKSTNSELSRQAEIKTKIIDENIIKTIFINCLNEKDSREQHDRNWKKPKKRESVKKENNKNPLVVINPELKNEIQEQTGLDISKIRTRARSTPGSEAAKKQEPIPSEVPEKTKQLAKDIGTEAALTAVGGIALKGAMKAGRKLYDMAKARSVTKPPVPTTTPTTLPQTQSRVPAVTGATAATTAVVGGSSTLQGTSSATPTATSAPAIPPTPKEKPVTSPAAPSVKNPWEEEMGTTSPIKSTSTPSAPETPSAPVDKPTPTTSTPVAKPSRVERTSTTWQQRAFDPNAPEETFTQRSYEDGGKKKRKMTESIFLNCIKTLKK